MDDDVSKGTSTGAGHKWFSERTWYNSKWGMDVLNSHLLNFTQVRILARDCF